MIWLLMLILENYRRMLRINTLFQTYALIQGRREARKIVAYTNSLEEVKIKSAVELRRLDVESQRNWYQYDLQKNFLTLYVDKCYQKTIDQITKEAQSVSREIETERCRAIREIDKYTISVTKDMDYRYQEMLRQEEAICAVYRDFIHDLTKQDLSRQKIAAEIGIQAITNSHKLSDAKFKIICDAIIKMTEPNYVTFEKFVKLHNNINYKNLLESD